MESNNLIVVTFSEANLDVTPATKAPPAVVTTLPNLDAPFFNMLPLLIAVAAVSYTHLTLPTTPYV